MDNPKVISEVQKSTAQKTPTEVNKFDEFDFGDSDFDVDHDDRADCWCGD